MKFTGSIEGRSSKFGRNKSGAPPGEAEILRMNPGRVNKIMCHTGWAGVWEGTLNVMVDEKVVHGLLLCTPLFVEKGDEVTYPPSHAHIPRLRVGYLYYQGVIANSSGESYPVLVRRACNPLLDRVEIFSDVKLRDKLLLEDDDEVHVTISSV